MSPARVRFLRNFELSRHDGIEVSIPQAPTEVASVLGAIAAAYPSSFIALETETDLRKEAFVSLAQTSLVCRSARFCLVLTEQSLHEIDNIDQWPAEVGVVLRVTDLALRWGALSHPLVEAIRFDNQFVVEAMRSMRTACIVRAMSDLAQDIGLARIGPDVDGIAASSPGLTFDYYSDAIDCAWDRHVIGGAIRDSPARTVAGSAIPFPAR